MRRRVIILVTSILVGVVVLFFGIWFGVTTYLAKSSGWKSLAEQYPNTSQSTGEEIPKIVAQLNGASYRGVIDLEATPEGLRLIIDSFFFNNGHPPIFIPWSELQAPDSGVSITGFSTTKVPEVKMRFYEDADEWVLQKKKQYESVKTN